MLGRFDEAAEILVGDGVLIHPKTVHRYVMRGCFFRIVPV
jgi:hypothetical protein